MIIKNNINVIWFYKNFRIIYMYNHKPWSWIIDMIAEGQLLAICVDLFMAGSETSAKALCFGFLFLVLNPEVQRRAQREIDAVIGHERLPSLNDRPRYICMHIYTYFLSVRYWLRASVFKNILLTILTCA